MTATTTATLQDMPVATLERKRFNVDLPLVKSAGSDGSLVLKGYANTWKMDRDGDIVDPAAFDDSLPAYLANNPILLWQHNHDWPIGSVKGATVDDNGLHVEAIVPKPEAGADGWQWSAYGAIKAGTVRTFSIGGFMEYDVSEKQLIIRQVDLFEISVVSIPANPESIFEAAVKAANGLPMVRLSDRAIEQMKQVTGAETISDPEIADMDQKALTLRYSELESLYLAANCEPPAEDAWHNIEKRLEGGEPDLDLMDEILAFVAAAEGTKLVEVEKAGRVLSKANERKLAAAVAMIDEVLAIVRQDEEAPKAAKPTATKALCAMKQMGMAPCDMSFDEFGASQRLQNYAKTDEGAYEAAFLTKHPNPDKSVGEDMDMSYKHQVADIMEDGTMQYVPQAIFKAAENVQEQGDPDEDAVKGALTDLYQQVNDNHSGHADHQPPWSS